MAGDGGLFVRGGRWIPSSISARREVPKELRKGPAAFLRIHWDRPALGRLFCPVGGSEGYRRILCPAGGLGAGPSPLAYDGPSSTICVVGKS